MDPGLGLVSPDWSRIDDSAIRHSIAELAFATIRQTHPAVKQCDKAALSLRPISPLAFFITESRLSCVRNITQGTGAAVWSQTTPARHRSLSVWVEIDHSSAAKRLGVTVSQNISLSSPPFSSRTELRAPTVHISAGTRSRWLLSQTREAQSCRGRQPDRHSGGSPVGWECDVFAPTAGNGLIGS